MAIKTVDELKTFFETGDKPTQQQFWDWLDSFFHKSDGIAIDNVSGLSNALTAKKDKAEFDIYEQGVLITANGDVVFPVSAGTVIERITTNYGSNAVLALSIVSNGGEDVMPQVPINAGWQQPLNISFAIFSDGNLYLYGVPAGSKINVRTSKFKMS